MQKGLAKIALVAFALCLPAKAGETISAECNNSIRATLNISNRQVSVTGSASAFNLESVIQLNRVSKAGYTAIFYGGQSNTTVGHGESSQLSTAELETKKGRYSCIIK